jgi:hypothetical protein
MRRLDQSDNSISTFQAADASVDIRRRSAGESQMAVTAIDHGGRVVTVTSQLTKVVPTKTPQGQGPTFTTSIHGGPLNASIWQANSWNTSLENHAVAVTEVVKLITSDANPIDDLIRR